MSHAEGIDIVPAVPAYATVARCLMLHGPLRRPGAAWIDLAEDLFARLGAVPERAIGRRGGGTVSFGSYRRVRKRLRALLDDPDASATVQLDGRIREGSPRFFDCEARLVLNGDRSAVLAVHEERIEGCDALLERTGRDLFSALGPAYRFALNFPATFGPDGYLVGLICSPESVLFSPAVRAYGGRLTRCRDRLWEGRLPIRGYLREVYPTNLLLDAHLAAPLRGRPLADHLRRVGRLGPSGLCEGVHRWDVAPGDLDAARREFEASGLVLSADTPLLLLG